MHDHLENVLRGELDMLEEKYRNDQEISSSDLEKVDKVVHALKCMETYKAMTEGYDDGQSERSYARGRSRVTGRYISRDGGSRTGGSNYPPREVLDPYWDRR